MWIHTCLFSQTNFDSKKWSKKKLFDKTKTSMPFIPMERMSLWCPIMKGEEITLWIYVYPNWKTNFNSKKRWKESFSYETKASMSFIPMSRMSLWCPIMKRKGILCESMFVLIDKQNLTLKTDGKRSFSFETKASISFILMKWICLWCLVMKKKEIILWICVYPNWKMNFYSKNSKKRSFFLQNESINISYPNKKNVFIVPNHEKKRDYYLNPVLS